MRLSMGKENSYLNPMEIMISLEEFDALEGEHVFSEKYKKKKQRLLKKYHTKLFGPSGRKGWDISFKAAAAVLILFTTGMVSAEANSDFFYRIWGTLGRKSVESHEEMLYDDGKDFSVTITYPERIYTDENLDRAEELIGEAISCETIEKQIGDTKLTILATACDEHSAVVEFTLERDGGVNVLQYSQLDNESKGAWFKEDAPFYFWFADCAENIFVDLNRSTEDLLYCYDYLITLTGKQMEDNLIMEIFSASPSEEGQEAEKLLIPLASKATQREYYNEAGGRIIVSPLSMKIDMNTVPGLTEEEAGDPWHAYYIEIKYRDGTSYLVHEHEIEDIHLCEKETDNVSYTLENLENQLIFMFNRLIDTEKVASITVNETTYAAQ